MYTTFKDTDDFEAIAMCTNKHNISWTKYGFLLQNVKWRSILEHIYKQLNNYQINVLLENI